MWRSQYWQEMFFTSTRHFNTANTPILVPAGAQGTTRDVLGVELGEVLEMRRHAERNLRLGNRLALVDVAHVVELDITLLLLGIGEIEHVVVLALR